jgi:hypothetical protein
MSKRQPDFANMTHDDMENLLHFLTQSLKETAEQQQRYDEESESIRENREKIIEELKYRLLHKRDGETNTQIFDFFFAHYGITSPKLKSKIINETFRSLDNDLPKIFNDLCNSLYEMFFYMLRNFEEYIRTQYKEGINSPYGKNFLLLFNLLIIIILFMGNCLPDEILQGFFNLSYIGPILSYIFYFRDCFYKLFKCQVYFTGLITIIDAFPFTANFKIYIQNILEKIMNFTITTAAEVEDTAEISVAINAAETHFIMCNKGPQIIADFANALYEGIGFNRSAEVMSEKSSAPSTASSLTVVSNSYFIHLLDQTSTSPRSPRSPRSPTSQSSQSSQTTYYTANMNSDKSYPPITVMSTSLLPDLTQLRTFCPETNSSISSISYHSTRDFEVLPEDTPKVIVERTRSEPPGPKPSSGFNSIKTLSQNDIADPKLKKISKLTEAMLKHSAKKQQQFELFLEKKGLEKKGKKGGTKRRKSKKTKRNSRRLKRRSNRKRRRSSKR